MVGIDLDLADDEDMYIEMLIAILKNAQLKKELNGKKVTPANLVEAIAQISLRTGVIF